ncbi:MAG: Uma2 family endonuclease [Bryobacteraceae bacterium]
MTTAATAISFEQFIGLPETPGVKRELVCGEVIELGSGNWRHELTKSNLLLLLALYVAQRPEFRMFGETMFRLSEEYGPQPDLAIVRTEHLSEITGAHFSCVPVVAVEVVSSESAEFLEKKTRLYLRKGTRAVWSVYPEERLVRVFHSDHSVRDLWGEQMLEDPEVLPGFRAPLSDVFQGL